jgi:hypothetical protein
MCCSWSSLAAIWLQESLESPPPPRDVQPQIVASMATQTTALAALTAAPFFALTQWQFIKRHLKIAEASSLPFVPPASNTRGTGSARPGDRGAWLLENSTKGSAPEERRSVRPRALPKFRLSLADSLCRGLLAERMVFELLDTDRRLRH